MLPLGPDVAAVMACDFWRYLSRLPMRRAGPSQNAARPSADAAAPVLLTVDETAALLRTSRKAIYAMVERARLPGVVRIGRRVLFRRVELIQWLDRLGTPSYRDPTESPKG
jgi:excisionase family DNA binding protein